MTDEQRNFLIRDLLNNEEYDIRHGDSEAPLRELGEHVLLIARLFDFAKGNGPLREADRRRLIAMIGRHGREAQEAHDHEVAQLPLTEAGDPRYMYEGRSVQESVAMSKEYAAREQREVGHCEAIISTLSAGEPVPA